MYLIVGLGNPGKQYENNRHNIGYKAIDAIHQELNFSPWTRKFQSFFCENLILNKKIYLVKPLTFMNLSGQAVGEIMHFFKITSKNLLVIHDDLDLKQATLRFKIGGGSGGHNGIKSIDSHCGNNYKRLRLGIGHPGQKHLVHNYVLNDFSKQETAWLLPLLQAIGCEFPLILSNQDNLFMNKINLIMKPFLEKNREV